MFSSKSATLQKYLLLKRKCPSVQEKLIYIVKFFAKNDVPQSQNT
ncbi:protein of unknown function [Xenorhabdus poinarii G6]|uniref:Uncharacterized protein n=1 Tax=Xenorhabdus poinarii G6 TaxID=1354304 RepID=A0A068QZR1_9GAMM|nr:protein of unknown function [Xenorhabdus poinarii G6]